MTCPRYCSRWDRASPTVGKIGAHWSNDYAVADDDDDDYDDDDDDDDDDGDDDDDDAD